MTTRQELLELAGRVAERGGMVVFEYDPSETVIESVTVSGVAGIGPGAMTPISAAERLREALAA